MRVLVTGGAGFIGSHIVDALLAEGHAVSVVDDLSAGKRAQVAVEARFYACDITSAGLMDVATEVRPEVVIHQAAQVRVPRSIVEPDLDARVNILGSVMVLEAARRVGARKVVYASSAAVYGAPVRLPIDEEHPIAPLSPYGVSKYTVEHYLAVYAGLHGIEYTALRYGNVYGPRQDAHGEAGVVTLFTTALLSGQTATIFGTGEQTRDFVYVGDVARANVAALERGSGLAINVGSGQPTAVRALYTTMAEIAQRPATYTAAPARPGDIEHSWFDVGRARVALGWTPWVDLRDGLAATIADYAATRGSGQT